VSKALTAAAAAAAAVAPPPTTSFVPPPPLKTTTLNGGASNGSVINSTASNGVTSNGTAVNGVVSNATTTNGTASNGIASNGTSFAPARRKLPANVTITPLTSEWIPSFKRLNSLLLPIPYPQKFYDEILEDAVTADISIAALWHEGSDTALAYTNDGQTPTPSAALTPPSTNGMNGTAAADAASGPPKNHTQDKRPLLVSAIRCRILPTPSHEPASERTLYISTLCTLSPYQSHGLASHLLSLITARAVKKYGVTSVTAHVWEANEEARIWYKGRNFEECGSEEGYYRKLRPTGAVAVRRGVAVGDLLGWE